ncbi:hypothetical protein SAMN04489835_2174 [Mycolicibacterium rutilum]|uniref:Copper(I)-binding protein n=1 Tax=Mycolicibacterium rutilum TaxID=370526 RepID=A0A1H6JTB4_MYCRU|nr:copper chaperone PCu(A)C [Mycolicibacterium rutilum]SEH62552.1 hypothetical protein SAMN04489835_2174 [Mycolicibacterium rutilum]
MRSGRLLAAAAVCVLLAGGCTSPEQGHDEALVTVEDAWATAAETGMAAVFGTLTNAGQRDAVLVSGDSTDAARVEIHEVVSDTDGAKTMRPKPGGLTIPAGGTHALVPGGDHLMLMDLKHPLTPGSDVTVTVAFEDGSTLPVTAQVRDFAGASEPYQGAPSHDHG